MHTVSSDPQSPTEVSIISETLLFGPRPSLPSFPPFDLHKRDLSDVKFAIAQNDDLETRDSLARSVAEGTDLIAGSYEGGLKTWECSVDLVAYLAARLGDEIRGRKVLEVNVGVGGFGGRMGLTWGGSP